MAALLLPTDVRLGLAFSYVDPTLQSAFTALPPHRHRPHPVQPLDVRPRRSPDYALSVMAGHRDRFNVAFSPFLLLGYAVGLIAIAPTVRTSPPLEADPSVAALRARARPVLSDPTAGTGA